MMKKLALILLLCLTSNVLAEKPVKQRVVDIYINETRRLDHTVEFYAWIDDSGNGCRVEDPTPEICVGWLQGGATYLTNKGGREGEGLQGQSMVLVTIGEPDKGWVDGGSGREVKIWFGKINKNNWDGKIHIEVPYKSTYKIHRASYVEK